MKTEIVEQGLRAMPAVGGAAVSTSTNPSFAQIVAGLSINQWVAIATGLYILLQGLYLLRKWYREEKDWSRKGRAKKEAR